MTHLTDLAFRPLPLASIRPAGWLKRQLEIQRDGLSGHLHEFWPDIKDSAWFGGDAEGWERAPYWLDGVIPLAHLLDDEELTARVHEYMDYILKHQADDGWLGPRRKDRGDADDKAQYDMWAVLLALKVLCVYHDASGDERALDAAERALAMLGRHTEDVPLFDWGEHRWFEGLIPIFYLYEKRRDARVLHWAQRLMDQGFDWRELIRGKQIEEATPIRDRGWRQWRHVVNLAMAVKAHGLVSRLTDSQNDREFCLEMIARLDRLHGQASGVFSGDECVSGTSPLRGTELCAGVEYMYSLEVMSSILDDTAIADRLEQITFNALPATFTPDMWGHQYDQQANQVLCAVNPEHRWSTNGPDSNLMGVEPNYGCCTANLSQAWPKFAAHLWMRTPSGGFAAMAYAPCTVSETKDGVPVRISVETDYPFRERITIHVETEEQVRFDLQLRIPAWCDAAQLDLGNGTVSTPTPGRRVTVDREWHGKSTLHLDLPMQARLEHRHNNAVTVHRGPLVYSLSISEDWRTVADIPPGSDSRRVDKEVHPVTPWNFALDLDKEIAFDEVPIGDCPFSPDGAPIVGTAQARRLAEWQLVNGWADETPGSPVSGDSPPEEVKLIPYGCSTLRITEFPWCSKREKPSV